jgi:transmembrane sensor
MTRRHDDDRITLEAAQWLMELQTDDAACRAAFAQWLRRSPEHIEEFLCVSGLSMKLDGIDPDRRIDIDELLAQPPVNVVELPAKTGNRPLRAHARRAGRSKWTVGLAAACALVAVLVLARWSILAGDTYETQLGEQRTVRLEDGSLISMNTQSRIEVSYSEQVREVRLLGGEALFSVEHDARRPFRVLSGSTTVQAIGTQFNVYRSETGTRVSVVEGVVKVTTDAAGAAPIADANSRRLSAGEQVEIYRDRLEATRSSDVASTIAWRERRLVFHDKPLVEIAAEFNRYNSIKFEIGSDVDIEPLTGVFAADRPESFARFLARDPTLRVEQHGQRLIVRTRTAAERR